MYGSNGFSPMGSMRGMGGGQRQGNVPKRDKIPANDGMGFTGEGADDEAPSAGNVGNSSQLNGFQQQAIQRAATMQSMQGMNPQQQAAMRQQQQAAMMRGGPAGMRPPQRPMGPPMNPQQAQMMQAQQAQQAQQMRFQPQMGQQQQQQPQMYQQQFMQPQQQQQYMQPQQQMAQPQMAQQMQPVQQFQQPQMAPMQPQQQMAQQVQQPQPQMVQPTALPSPEQQQQNLAQQFPGSFLNNNQIPVVAVAPPTGGPVSSDEVAVLRATVEKLVLTTNSLTKSNANFATEFNKLKEQTAKHVTELDDKITKTRQFSDWKFATVVGGEDENGNAFLFEKVADSVPKATLAAGTIIRIHDPLVKKGEDIYAPMTQVNAQHAECKTYFIKAYDSTIEKFLLTDFATVAKSASVIFPLKKGVVSNDNDDDDEDDEEDES